MKDVTFALTSCNRPDLLEYTIDSFLLYNTYPIAKYIIIEDSCICGINDYLKSKYKHLNIEWIDNEIKLGQIKSIDKMYSHIDTEYIFHCEEDWVFTANGFIEKSMVILDNQPNVLNVWLRDSTDTNGHPIDKIDYYCDDVKFNLMSKGYMDVWNGFTFNPGLRRLSDYKLIASYSNIGHEAHISVKYGSLGYRSAILGTKYVEHIGWDRHVKDIHES